jgi:hypothetical protein
VVTGQEARSAAQDRLLKAVEAVLAKCESSGYLIGTKEYVNLCAAVKDAGGTDSWKARRGLA